ncbi:hypothetical protein GCM10020367_10530 [Streptomyces sannanensis]|uniref:MarR family transcriptional regulator n=1 Tax=Streptomyces sannanensis TaxID=285536 RepID=A0ABP6S667_9ACTN
MRHPQPPDGRHAQGRRPRRGIAREFVMTAEGERRLDADRAANLSGLARVMADCAPEETAELAELLGRLNRDNERLDGHPWPRD